MRRNGSKVDFDNLQGEKKYSMLGAYGQSKLELNLLTLELARRLEGSGVTANFLHPGLVRTDLARDINPAAKAIFSVVKFSHLCKSRERSKDFNISCILPRRLKL